MAQVHLIGQLVGGSEFPQNSLFCKWMIIAEGGWTVMAGVQGGQTQVDHPADNDMAHWAHPIDVHFSTKGIQNPPKFILEVWYQDMFGRNQLVGYGQQVMPLTAGFHQLTCHTWRPVGSKRDQFSQALVGGSIELKSLDLIGSQSERYQLLTQSSGKVHLELSVILRDFAKYGIDN